MNIAITGANGFVGQYLCQHLLGLQLKPIAITRKLWSIEGVENRVISDYTNVDKMQAALEGCETVVILASKTHSGSEPTTENLASYRNDNLDTAVATMQSAIKTGAKRVVYLSSIKVNGEITFGSPFSVASKPNPIDAYGITKHETERALFELSQSSNIELTVIRSPLIYGLPLKGNLALLGQLIEKGIPLPFASIKNRRDIIALPVLCDLISQCLDHKSAAGETFLAADGVNRSTADIVHLISTNRSPRLFSFPKSMIKLVGLITGKQLIVSRLISDLEIDISHTCKTLNWEPPIYNNLRVIN
jgi:UDP-glucose 4-epimerase